MVSVYEKRGCFFKAVASSFSQGFGDVFRCCGFQASKKPRNLRKPLVGATPHRDLQTEVPFSLELVKQSPNVKTTAFGSIFHFTKPGFLGPRLLDFWTQLKGDHSWRAWSKPNRRKRPFFLCFFKNMWCKIEAVMSFLFVY